jgi:predicted nuclease with RNAse H fold
MPAKNPRLNIVLEEPIYEALERIARRDGASLSQKARDLLLEAMEAQEDLALAAAAAAREATFERGKALSHEQALAAFARAPRR